MTIGRCVQSTDWVYAQPTQMSAQRVGPECCIVANASAQYASSYTAPCVQSTQLGCEAQGLIPTSVQQKMPMRGCCATGAASWLDQIGHPHVSIAAVNLDLAEATFHFHLRFRFRFFDER